ncbi:Rhs element Vgr protein [Roseateles sp. YR242]|uniref:type VI secretion system Vgr family protein n=1 Tax=Roseateles sp. YR242 TaxID=1855305 RepID=UPI0008BD4373|nr:type VI secretion system tip protein TssI/VgrG [Roseateles sp. YR242]SEK22535.1 Rhs element Vgr protein [Roseateles sp. YR242]
MTSQSWPAEATFHPPPTADGPWRLRHLDAQEVVNGVPRYELILDGPADDGVANRLLGRPASVRLPLASGEMRHLHGWVAEVETADRSPTEGDDQRPPNSLAAAVLGWRIVLRPWLNLLGLNSPLRAFRHKTTGEILQAVLDAYSPHAQVEHRHRLRFHPRPWAIQYRESDLDFIRRLLADEGLIFWLEHDTQGANLILADASARNSSGTGPTLSWQPPHPSSGQPAQPSQAGQRPGHILWNWSRRRQLQAVQVSLHDFSAEVPDQTLQAQSRRPLAHAAAGPLRYAVHPGFPADEGPEADIAAHEQAGQRRAESWAHAFANQADLSGAQTSSREVLCGHDFELVDHPVDAGRYRVLAIRFELRQAGHGALRAPTDDFDDSPAGPLWRAGPRHHLRPISHFVAAVQAVPADQPLAPAVTPPGCMPGPQSATVIGPPGESVHADRDGRVRIRFHWEIASDAKTSSGPDGSDENAGGWVRVCQSWSGSGFGVMAHPRIGDEVLVGFLDGHPDRPIVIGRLHNRKRPPPYLLPQHASISGWRSQVIEGSAGQAHEIRFEDRQQAAYVWMQSQADWHLRIGRDQQESIQGHSWSWVGGDRRQEINGQWTLAIKNDSRLDLAANTDLQLGGDLRAALAGNGRWRVDGDLALRCGKTLALHSDAEVAISASQPLRLSSNIKAEVQAPLAVVLQSDTRISLSAGGSFLTLGPEGVSISGPLVLINSGGSALSAGRVEPPTPSSPQRPDALPEHQDPLEGTS